jgi:hypothetical protein
MEAITKRMIVDRDESEYFECVAEDGTVYRVRDWDDDEFNKASMISALKDDDTTARGAI